MHDTPPDDSLPDLALAESWRANAGRWTDAVRHGRIESRRLVTDRAVLDAVLARRPRRVLDLGCGEGWLARALVAAAPTPALSVVGIDASPELIARAQALEPGGHGGRCDFQAVSYADLIAQPRRLGPGFDVVVANFALLDEALDPLLAALTRCLEPGGTLIVQTLHPSSVPPPYVDGWRVEDFAGFGAGGDGETGAWTAMPWHFRTLGSWMTAIAAHFRVATVAEPLHPGTGRPASLLVTARLAADPDHSARSPAHGAEQAPG